MRERSQIPSCRTCKSYSKDSSVCYYGKPQETCPIFKAAQLPGAEQSGKSSTKTRKPRQAKP